ncbi:hypothetical protein K470DRAFT_222119 [Piedraia hortae CBS 480.64]|uniref:Roadblock/LAMTOR2 domain-containing protein n=1 Tax=Piedraia hortae CBS 480.64 TaxID=1314780 RepID=A0A6A7BU62_9PEZI|nr:hypothetical protein K470DRAFT_222119 [Piedraia hortae CBS 480.64]
MESPNAAPAPASAANEVDATLSSLSSRPGVQSTLILSRETGAIVRSTGLVVDDNDEEEAVQGAEVHENVNGTVEKGTRSATAVATLVHAFMQSAGKLVQDLNGDNDEAKLVRLRTKKNEFVIVPDGKFLLVVVSAKSGAH